MNNNLKNVQISGIRRFFNEVVKYPSAISLTLGQPDFAVPEAIKNAMINAINNNYTNYTANAGLYELRYEISKYLSKKNIFYRPEEICLTVGGSEALYSSLSALLNASDRLLIPSAAYPAYESIGKILGANIFEYGLRSDFTLDIDAIKALIDKNSTNYLILSFPSNPTGAILDKKAVEELHRLVLDNNIIVITDEIYSELCYEDYYSIAAYEDIREKIVYIGGFSKMFSMTGLRVGFLCAAKEVFEQILKVHQYNVSCTNSVAQYGALEGLKHSMEEVEKMKEQFIIRRDFVYKELTSMGLSSELPKGAFYIFPSIKDFHMSSESFCHKLLKEANVACVPGSAFGRGGEGHIRISYCYSLEELKKAFDRINGWINRY